MMIQAEGQRLLLRGGHETVWIEPWGADSLRVRGCISAEMDGHDWALTEPVEETDARILMEERDIREAWEIRDGQPLRTGTFAVLENGGICAEVTDEGWITFRNRRGEVLTQEYWRDRNRMNRHAVPLRISAREMKPIPGCDDMQLCARFEAFDGERIFGMGQYQDSRMDKKGAVLELAHRNSQASVPFYISSRGYGFLWNNPAVGQAVFGTNRTEWTALSTKKLDYFITAGDTPADILRNYTRASGRVPVMPEYGLGYWQCKLRYRTQEEFLAMICEHKRRGLPMDVAVIDFFHWTLQGDFKFDPVCWPDPAAMVEEMNRLGVRCVVSVWPTVDERSENRGEMAEKGYLVQTDRGTGVHMTWMGATAFYDATNPEAQRYVYEKCRENYGRYGIRTYWLDEAEPEYGPYDFDLYRYWAGPALQVTNSYPVGYAKGFFEGLRGDGEEDIISLVRCAWAGSQKYGVLCWSGDVHSTFRAMREQLQAGLSMAAAGIPWWTCDLGGFIGGVNDDPAFRELLARWFAWGCFLPVFRMHGERQPWYPQEPAPDGVQRPSSGQANEIWSFGEEMYAILRRYLFIRERLRPYLREVMAQAHESGAPVMRPLWYEFPEDPACWDVEDSYCLGGSLLIAPVLEAGARERSVYLPAGAVWKDAFSGIEYTGGQRVTVDAPLEMIPVFIRDGRDIPVYAE